MRSIVCAIVAAAALLVSAAATQADRFALAIVRLDGRLVPFAAYDAGTWERAWPEPDRTVAAGTMPDSIASVWQKRGEPVPLAWRVLPIAGGRTIAARVTGVDVAEAHCERQAALTTGLPPRKDNHHAQKMGVAIDADLPLGAIASVGASDPTWAAAAQVVGRTFDRLELATALATGEVVARETPAPVARITALFREAAAPDSPLYFIAEKKFRTPRYPQDPTCGARTIVTGFLTRTPNGPLTLRDPRVFLTNCDAKTALRSIPLAALHTSDRVFWVLLQRGYESEAFAVADIGPDEIRYPISVRGGGC